MKYTYIVRLDGDYYAFGANEDMSVVYSLDSPVFIPFIRGIYDRNRAVMQAARPMLWKDAINLARREGQYMGQLYDL